MLLGGNCAARRQQLLAMEGFDQQFFPGAEDKDLALRYAEAGHQLMTAPAMRLAIRLRERTGGQARRNFEHGRMYMKLASAHGFTATSRVLHQPDFRVDFLRALAAATVLTMRHSPRRADAISRLALRTGQVIGWAEQNILRQPLRSKVGIGLPSTIASNEPSRPS